MPIKGAPPNKYPLCFGGATSDNSDQNRLNFLNN